MKFLRDIVQIEKGRKYNLLEENQEGAIRVFQANDFRNENKPLFTLDADGVLAQEDDIMLVWDGSVGQMGFGRSGYVGSTMVKLKVKNKKQFSPFFIYRFLQTKSEYLKRKATGATIMHINRKSLEQLEIPELDLTDQLHISNLLSKAENLISQRKESIRLLDELLKSTFLEMFGDPVRNDKGWEVNILGSVINGIDSGWSPVCLNKPRNSDSEWAILKLGSVTYRKFNPKENKLLNQSIEIKKELVPKKGNLLFSRKNTYQLVGATVFIFEDHKRLILPDTIFNIKYVSEKVSGLYLWFLFNDLKFRNVIQSLASGAAGSMPNISKEKLRKLKISLPPISLQTEFAQIVEKTEALKARYQQSLTELENLYCSLSQKAFRGELGLKDEGLLMAAEPEVNYSKSAIKHS